MPRAREIIPAAIPTQVEPIPRHGPEPTLHPTAKPAGCQTPPSIIPRLEQARQVPQQQEEVIMRRKTIREIIEIANRLLQRNDEINKLIATGTIPQSSGKA